MWPVAWARVVDFCLGYGREIYALLAFDHYLCSAVHAASSLSVVGSVSMRWHADACGEPVVGGGFAYVCAIVHD